MSRKKSSLERLLAGLFFKTKKNPPHGRKRKLGIESLEAREMLSGIGFVSVHHPSDPDETIVVQDLLPGAPDVPETENSSVEAPPVVLNAVTSAVPSLTALGQTVGYTHANTLFGIQNYTVQAVIENVCSTPVATSIDMPLSAPSEFRATLLDDNVVELTWNAADAATHYIVQWQDGQGNWATLDDSVTATSYTHSGLPGGRHYYRLQSRRGEIVSERYVSYSIGARAYAVRAYRGTSYSGFIEVDVDVVLGVPSVTAATSTYQSVQLAWNPIAGATHYGVWWWSAAQNKWMDLDRNVAGTSYVDTTAPLGARTYAVRAYQGTVYSGFVALDVEVVPAAPTNLTASVLANRNVKLTWTGVSGATHYIVECQYDGETWRISHDSLTGTWYPDSFTTPGVRNYRVYARMDGIDSAATEVSVDVPPAAPRTLYSMVNEDKTVRLAWGSSADITHYVLQWENTRGEWETLVDSPSPTNYTHMLTTVGVRNYRVFARNNDTYSEAVSLTVIVRPGQVEDLEAWELPDKTVQLTWAPKDGATDYLVWYGDGQGEWELIDDSVKTPSFIHTLPISPLERREYLVSSIVEGTESFAQRVYITGLPDTPANLEATVLDDGSVRLSWDAAEGATYYVVEWQDGQGDWQSLERLCAKTNYTHALTTPGVRNYRVCSLTRELYSAPAEVSATVFPAAPKDLTAMIPVYGSVRLEWSPVPGATYYRISRVEAGMYETILSTNHTGTTITETGVPSGTYDYYVTPYCETLPGNYGTVEVTQANPEVWIIDLRENFEPGSRRPPSRSPDFCGSVITPPGKSGVKIYSQVSKKIEDGTEGDTDGLFRIYRDDIRLPLTVDYVVSGTATNGTDYERIGGSVTFGVGESFVDLPILVNDDTVVEADETVIIRLVPRTVPGTGIYDIPGTSTRPSVATLTIYENDVAPKVWIEKIRDGEEGGADGLFRIRRDNTEKGLRVTYAISGTAREGGDYSGLGFGDCPIPEVDEHGNPITSPPTYWGHHVLFVEVWYDSKLVGTAAADSGGAFSPNIVSKRILLLRPMFGMW